MYEDFMEAAIRIYLDGMSRYQQIVDDLLMTESELLEDEKITVKRILDVAREMFEKEMD